MANYNRDLGIIQNTQAGFGARLGAGSMDRLLQAKKGASFRLRQQAIRLSITISSMADKKSSCLRIMLPKQPKTGRYTLVSLKPSKIDNRRIGRIE